MITCENCKSIVELPPGFFEATIRCGICWAEVIIDRPPVKVEESESEPEELPSPLPVPQPVEAFESLPGRVAKGMEPMESLLKEVSTRLPQLFIAPPRVEKQPHSLPEESRPSKQAAVVRVVDEGLRRRRGAESSQFVANEPPTKSIPLVTLGILALVVIGVFAVGYFLMMR